MSSDEPKTESKSKLDLQLEKCEVELEEVKGELKTLLPKWRENNEKHQKEWDYFTKRQTDLQKEKNDLENRIGDIKLEQERRKTAKVKKSRIYRRFKRLKHRIDKRDASSETSNDSGRDKLQRGKTSEYYGVQNETATCMVSGLERYKETTLTTTGLLQNGALIPDVPAAELKRRNWEDVICAHILGRSQNWLEDNLLGGPYKLCEKFGSDDRRNTIFLKKWLEWSFDHNWWCLVPTETTPWNSEKLVFKVKVLKRLTALDFDPDVIARSMKLDVLRDREVTFYKGKHPSLRCLFHHARISHDEAVRLRWISNAENDKFQRFRFDLWSEKASLGGDEEEWESVGSVADDDLMEEE
jgi:hypothetical protein